MKPRIGFTLLEILLSIMLVLLLSGTFVTIMIWETRIYSMTSERNSNTARLMDANLLLVKFLHGQSPIDLTSSTSNEVASGATSYFKFDNVQKQLLFKGAPILDQVVGTFSYNGANRADSAGASWTVNWPTAILQIDLNTTGNNPEPLRILVHPQKK